MNRRSHIRNLILAAAGLMVVLSIASAANAQQDVTVASTSKFAGGRWDWTVFLRASPAVLQSIRCVEYKLPSSSKEPNRKVCVLGNTSQPFAVQTTNWGAFDIPIRITFKNGQVRTLTHTLRVSKS